MSAYHGSTAITVKEATKNNKQALKITKNNNASNSGNNNNASANNYNNQNNVRYADKGNTINTK